jgi:hypothetical protein
MAHPFEGNGCLSNRQSRSLCRTAERDYQWFVPGSGRSGWLASRPSRPWSENTICTNVSCAGYPARPGPSSEGPATRAPDPATYGKSDHTCLQAWHLPWNLSSAVPSMPDSVKTTRTFQVPQRGQEGISVVDICRYLRFAVRGTSLSKHRTSSGDLSLRRNPAPPSHGHHQSPLRRRSS